MNNTISKKTTNNYALDYSRGYKEGNLKGRLDGNEALPYNDKATETNAYNNGFTNGYKEGYYYSLRSQTNKENQVKVR